MTVPCRGHESICAGCVHGVVIRRMTTTSSDQRAMWAHENPGQDDPRPVREDLVDSYCTHPRMVGRPRQAREVGTVLDCELFEARKL